MKKKKANAFTLVEIISVIVIIGMFLVVMVPVISNAIVTSRLKFYEGQENSVQVSGRNYFTSNRERLPKEVGSKEIVSLRSLISLGYIKNVIDDQNKECDYDLSYVEVTNVGVGEYQYYVRLVCADYDSQTVFGEWSDWQLTYPSGQNIEIESANFYNYKEAFTYTDMGSCSNWTDVVGYKEDELKKVATIIDQDIQDRTVYSYQDQRWKWYKMDQKESACLESSPGSEWTFLKYGNCSPVIESYGSCESSQPSGDWSRGAECNPPAGPDDNPTGCRGSQPTDDDGGTWSWYRGCTLSEECPSGYDCEDWYCNQCVKYETHVSKQVCHSDCTTSFVWFNWCDHYLCEGHCCTNEAEQGCSVCSPGYSLQGWEDVLDSTENNRMADGTSCTDPGTRTTYKLTATSTCKKTTSLETVTGGQYIWTATPKYQWKRSIRTAIYATPVAEYYANYSSTEPSGYPLKDEAQFNYTVPSGWSIEEPTSFPYRTINSKEQKRSCNILQDWSGNKLTNYVLEEDLVSHLGKPLAEIKIDSNLKLTSIVKYRYRQRQLSN